MSEVAAIQLGIVVGYLVVALAIGVVAYRLSERTAEDYYLASRNFGTVVLLFTVFATLLSAFTFFGGPDESYLAGPEWLLIMGLMDGIIFAVLWYVIGYKQWLLGQRHGYLTLGEMLGDRFGSRYLRGLVAGVSLVWLFPYVMLQQMGAGAALTALTGGVVPYWAGAALITVFMIVYVVLAGMRGIAWTDTFQGLFMLVVIWAAAIWVLVNVGGPTAATASLEATSPELLALGSGPYTPQLMLTLSISIAFGVAMFPQVNQRFFVARSEAVMKRTLPLWPVVVTLLFVPAFLLGMWARGLGIEADVAAGESVLPLLLAEYTPYWFAALVVAGAIAAMMSSSDSMLLSGSSYFTRDLYRPFVDATVGARREDLLGRVGVVVFACATYVASLGRPGTLIEIGDLAFSGFAQLALPVMVALYWRGTTRAGITAGIAGSQLFYVASQFTAVVPATYAGWGASIVGMLLGLGLTIGVSLVTSRAVEEDVAAFATGSDAD